MQSKVPLPTDNIYKFYALFGLLLFLSCVYAFTSLYHSYNEKAFNRYIELEVLNSVNELTPVQIATKKVLEEQKGIDASDKQFFLGVIGGAITVSLLLMSYGFFRWHTKIQPQQDKTIEQQIEKTDLEIKALNKQIYCAPYRSRTH